MSVTRILQVDGLAPAATHSLPMLLLRLRETVLLQLRPVIRDFDLTEQQARVLIILNEAGPLEMVCLAEACCIHPPSLSRMVPKLRVRGLLTCHRQASDQRRASVALTAEGQAVAARLRTGLRRAHGAVTSRIGGTRVRTIIGEIEDAILALGRPALMDRRAGAPDDRMAGDTLDEE